MFKADFPILQQEIAGKPIVYLDSAASAQKPQLVLAAMQNYYQQDHANVHRGIHTLSERASEAYEAARKTVKQFLHAKHPYEIIFTSGTTEAINLVANSFGKLSLHAGDEIIISTLEHHANIVPWQVICQQTGAQLRVVPLLADGSLDLSAYQALFTPRTRLVAIVHVSHVLGTVNPIKEMIALAHNHQVPVLVDGAQAVAHLPVDVQDLDCDFYVFSGHKLYGPTGIGVLYGKAHWLEKMPPYQTGGGMIRRVSFQHTEYAELPAKFEAGTPPIAEAVGLNAAIQFVEEVGFAEIISHERQLTDYALQRLREIPGIRILNAPASQVGVISIVMDQAHSHDIATILASDAVAVRAGHHCAMPLMEYLHVSGTTRISFGLYNNRDDIECLLLSLRKVTKLFKV